jgi:hypothetical protein
MEHYGGTNCKVDRRCKVKSKIKNWDRMVDKLKAKFIPKDYQVNLFRNLHQSET